MRSQHRDNRSDDEAFFIVNSETSENQRWRESRKAGQGVALLPCPAPSRRVLGNAEFGINEFNSPFRIPHSAFFVRRGSPDPAVRLNAWGVRHAVDRMRALRSLLYAGIALVHQGEAAFRAESVPFGTGAFGLERRMRKRRPANFFNEPTKS
jgi:hypothetical protein